MVGESLFDRDMEEEEEEEEEEETTEVAAETTESPEQPVETPEQPVEVPEVKEPTLEDLLVCCFYIMSYRMIWRELTPHGGVTSSTLIWRE